MWKMSLVNLNFRAFSARLSHTTKHYQFRWHNNVSADNVFVENRICYCCFIRMKSIGELTTNKFSDAKKKKIIFLFIVNFHIKNKIDNLLYFVENAWKMLFLCTFPYQRLLSIVVPLLVLIPFTVWDKSTLGCFLQQINMIISRLRAHIGNEHPWAYSN